ncbi:MAG: hypothetical protein B6D63_03255 [Candidatus Latescibacteria bacterium 4484_7]|nr:MAG: hypothetical protein B6D63_03255 [Candidatus Latescibacteria bacterium 4484_7]
MTFIDPGKEWLIRALDLSMSTLLLISLSPLFFVVSIAIKLEDGGPVFFIQERVGHMGKLFRIIKFRSMIVDAEKKGSGLYIDGENDHRITRVGRFMRKWSIDEFPQLINVLKGEMSLVGPRPAMAFQVAEYTARQRMRLLVRPGITGWAQINGRNSLSWPERIEKDIWYIKHRSLALNLKIIILTIPRIFVPEGLYGEREKYLLKADVNGQSGEQSSPIRSSMRESLEMSGKNL